MDPRIQTKRTLYFVTMYISEASIKSIWIVLFLCNETIQIDFKESCSIYYAIGWYWSVCYASNYDYCTAQPKSLHGLFKFLIWMGCTQQKNRNVQQKYLLSCIPSVWCWLTLSTIFNCFNYSLYAKHPSNMGLSKWLDKY